MDTITHSLLGGLVVRAIFPARKKTPVPLSNRQRIAIGALAGAFPDIDYLASWIDPMVYLTQWHRGITHSLVMMPIWAMLLGILLAIAFRQRMYWGYFSLLAGAGILSHILSDLITVYGTQVFTPLSHWRASVGTTFIIDPWFSSLVLAGFIVGFRDKDRKWPILFLVGLTGYIVMQGVLKYQATMVARHFIQVHALKKAQATALPQPLSPFNWKLVVREERRYEVAYINLIGSYSVADTDSGFWADMKRTYRDADNPQWQAYYRYGQDTADVDWVRALWHDVQLNYFRQFAEMPILYRIDRIQDSGEQQNDADRANNQDTRTCVWFADLRFMLPYMTPPFRYGLCQDNPVATWKLYRLDWSGNPVRQ